MRKDVAKKWARELRSGKYAKGTDALNASGKFCCLGVLCELAIKNGVVVDKLTDEDTDVTYDGEYGSLPVAVQEWAEMQSQDGFFYDEKGTQTKRKNLTIVNDKMKYGFGRIADIIEKNYKAL